MKIYLENKRVVAKDGETELGEMTFMQPNANSYIITHTGVSDAARGLGVGKKLVVYLVDLARQNNQKILPICPFAKAEFEKHPEYQDVLLEN